MDTIFSLWINQDQRNGQRRAKMWEKVGETEDKRVSECLCHLKSNIEWEWWHTLLHFWKEMWFILGRYSLTYLLHRKWFTRLMVLVLTNNRFLSLRKNTVFFKLIFFLCAFSLCLLIRRWARHLLFLTSSLKRSGHQRRALWRRCRRSSWRTKSRGRNSTPGEEGSPSGLDSETDYACMCAFHRDQHALTYNILMTLLFL